MLAEVTTSEKICWHVLHTKARQEKALARSLDAAGIEHYLPLISRVRYRGPRRIVVREPLFASYLFLRGSIDTTYMAVATKRVANVIGVTNQTLFARELAQISLALTRGAELSPYRYLKVGRRARVKAGPFRDIEGLVEAWQNSNRLVLQVQALGRATSLEIDASLLEPVD
ncbi:MAG: transcription termination/antitermination protein NusG [Planctomycetota bacterium]